MLDSLFLAGSPGETAQEKRKTERSQSGKRSLAEKRKPGTGRTACFYHEVIRNRIGRLF